MKGVDNADRASKPRRCTAKRQYSIPATQAINKLAASHAIVHAQPKVRATASDVPRGDRVGREAVTLVEVDDTVTLSPGEGREV
jgi:hypothetical protein